MPKIGARNLYCWLSREVVVSKGQRCAVCASHTQAHTALTPLNSGEKLRCQHRDSFAVRLGGTVYKAN